MKLWQIIWTVWILFTVVSFGVLEGIALSITPKDTLSDTSWGWLGVVKGQDPLHWNAPHFLAAVIMLGFMVWLFGHINFGIWG